MGFDCAYVVGRRGCRAEGPERNDAQVSVPHASRAMVVVLERKPGTSGEASTPCWRVHHGPLCLLCQLARCVAQCLVARTYPLDPGQTCQS